MASRRPGLFVPASALAGGSERMLSHALRCFLVFTLVSVAARPASAQSFYVAGALGADIALVSGQHSGDFGVPTGGGEALSGAARLGVVLEPRWGIEFEVSRAGEIRETSRTGPVPLPLGIARPTFLPEIEFAPPRHDRECDGIDPPAGQRQRRARLSRRRRLSPH